MAYFIWYSPFFEKAGHDDRERDGRGVEYIKDKI
jgi:hypothetical protein